MATGSIIKIATNIPIVGVLSYVDFAKSKTEGWGDQISLKGHFDGHGEGKVYVADWLAKGMVDTGLIETNGLDRDGNQAYKVLYKGRVQILREEHAGKKVTTILPLDVIAAPTVAGAASPPPAVAPRVVAAPSQAARVPTGSAPVPVPPSSDPWAALERQYERARIVACRVWGEDYDPSALVAATATVFIQASKMGIPNPADDGPPEWLNQS